MWMLINNDLPLVADEFPNSGVALCSLDPGWSMAPLATVDFRAAYDQVTTAFDPVVLTVGLPEMSGSTVQVIVPTTIAQLEVVQQNGRTFTLAVDPTQLQPGEFAFDQSSQTVTLQSSDLEPGLPMQLLAGSPAIGTDFVDPGLFSVLNDLPVKGTISWNLSLENHPAGQLTLWANGDTIAEVQQRFRDGTELTMAGIGFFVSSYRQKLINRRDMPGLEYLVSISLNGRHQRRKYNLPSFLRLPSENLGRLPFQDPECQIGGQVSKPLTNQSSTTVAALAAQRGVVFQGASFPLLTDVAAIALMKSSASMRSALRTTRSLNASQGGWAVPIPADSPRDATQSWESAARERLRMNGTFIDFNAPGFVSARNIDDVARWAYTLQELDFAVKGDTEFSDTIFGYGFEYPVMKLAGDFSAPSGIQKIPQIRWKRKQPVRVTLSSGNLDAHLCPPELQWIRSMGQNADVSGPTQESISVTMEDGVEVRKVRKKYGLKYTSVQVTDSEGEEILAPAALHWTQVEEEVYELEIDPDTGVIRGSNSRGWKDARLRQETDEKELMRYELSAEEQPYRDLYEFRRFPIVAAERKISVPYSNYYRDSAQEKPPSEMQKVCHADGSSSLKPVLDPNWIPAMFDEVTRSYRNSFLSVPDPDSTDEAKKPDIMSGEETDMYKVIQVVPLPGGAQGADLFTEYVTQQSAQGAQLEAITVQRTFSMNQGRPSPVQRQPPRYEKEEPEPDSGNANALKPPNDTYEYVICSPGYSPTQAPGGSLSAPLSKTLSEALVQVKTEYGLQDIEQSVDFECVIPFNPAIRPMDRMSIAADATYATRVRNVVQKVEMQGLYRGYPLLSAPEGTVLTNGIDRSVNLTVTPQLVPQAPQATNPTQPTPRSPNAVPTLSLSALGFDKLNSRFSK